MRYDEGMAFLACLKTRIQHLTRTTSTRNQYDRAMELAHGFWARWRPAAPVKVGRFDAVKERRLVDEWQDTVHFDHEPSPTDVGLGGPEQPSLFG